LGKRFAQRDYNAEWRTRQNIQPTTLGQFEAHAQRDRGLEKLAQITAMVVASPANKAMAKNQGTGGVATQVLGATTPPISMIFSIKRPGVLTFQVDDVIIRRI